MNVLTAISRLFALSSVGKLPHGKDGDGISQGHAEGALKRLGEEHLPDFKKAEYEFTLARIELQRVSKDILKYVTDESYHELIDMAKHQITAIEELEREHVLNT